MTYGSVCSGIGGMDLGLKRAGFTVRWMCEIKEARRRALAKHHPGVHCYEDLKSLPAQNPERVRLLAGGFPCQPHSDAGEKKGVDDERNLWPNVIELVRFLGPDWCLFENVRGIRTTILSQCQSDLERAGYGCWVFVVGAEDVGSPQKRRRVFIVARQLVHANSTRLEGAKWSRIQRAETRQKWGGHDNEPARPMLLRDWPARPSQVSLIPIATDGLPGGLSGRCRRDWLEALGDAVVPDVAELMGRAIMRTERMHPHENT